MIGSQLFDNEEDWAMTAMDASMHAWEPRLCARCKGTGEVLNDSWLSKEHVFWTRSAGFQICTVCDGYGILEQ